MQDLSTQQAQGRAMSSAGITSTASRSVVQRLRGLDFAAGSALLAPVQPKAHAAPEAAPEAAQAEDDTGEVDQGVMDLIDKEYGSYVDAAVKEFADYSISAKDIKAKIAVESGGDKDEISKSGKDYGLMQIQQATWEEAVGLDAANRKRAIRPAWGDSGKYDFASKWNDPATNIMVGCAVFARKFADIEANYADFDATDAGYSDSGRAAYNGGGQTVGMAMAFAGSADYAEWTKPDPLKKSLKQQGFIHNVAKSGAKSAITQLTAAQIDGLNLRLPIAPQVTALLEKTEHAAQAAAIAQIIESKLQAAADRKYQVMIEYAPKQAGYIAAWEAREIAAAEAAAKAKGVTKDEATDETSNEATTDETSNEATTDEATTDGTTTEATTDAQDNGPYTLYTVKAQEGLFGITKSLGLTCHWQDVARANGINPDKPAVAVGQSLKILDSWKPQ